MHPEKNHWWIWRPRRRRHRGHTKLSVRIDIYVEEHGRYEVKGEINMVGLKGTLDVTIAPPVGDAMVMSVDTADDGTFAVQFTAEMEGVYKITVDYKGSSPYEASTATLEVTVVPVPIPTNIALVGPEVAPQVGQIVNVTGVLTI